MRLWIVNHYADPPDGLATRSFDIARRLVEKGNPTTIFVSNFSHYHFKPMRQIRGARLWRVEGIEGVTFVWLRTTPYRTNDWRRVLNMISFAILALVAGALRRESPDLVIGVSVHPLAALAAFCLARIKRARFFFEETDLWPETLIEFGRLAPDSLAARGMRTLERFLYRRAERIIMLWRHTGEYVESLGGSRERILWIPHGVELDRYAALETYVGAPRRPFRLMFLGSFVAGNAVEPILDAAKVLKDRGRRDIRIVLVGAGTNRETVMRRAREFQLEDVEFPAPVAKKQIAQMMNQADAFIYGLQDLPLYRFGISMNKVTDYLAAGRPIVFFGNSSYSPVAEARAGVTVPPGDAQIVADAIERLVALTPEERVQMGRNGREYVMEYHNIPKLADRLLEAMQPAIRQ